MTMDLGEAIPKNAPNDYDDGITKLDRSVIKQIPLVEMFGPTIQGEGTVIGQQTYFLRFGLCDYRCEMCDSLHAVLPDQVKKNAAWLTQEEILHKFQVFRHQSSTKWVTFSGGNPAIHDLTYLVGRLKMHEFKINVETQGTQYRGWLNKVDSLTISPKGPGMGEKHNHDVFSGFMDKVYENGFLFGKRPEWGGPNLCIKIVAFDQRDLDFAADVFGYLMEHPLFNGLDISNHFYLSLGNDMPPQPGTINEDLPAGVLRDRMIDHYKVLWEDIQNHPILSQVRFLPQWHAFVWGNAKGK